MNDYTRRKSTFIGSVGARTSLVGHGMRKVHHKCWRSRPLGHAYRRDDLVPGELHWSKTCVGCGKVKLRRIQ